MPAEVKVVLSAEDRTAAAFRAASGRLDELKRQAQEFITTGGIGPQRIDPLSELLGAPRGPRGIAIHREAGTNLGVAFTDGISRGMRQGEGGVLRTLKGMFGRGSTMGLLMKTLMGSGALMAVGVGAHAFAGLGQGIEAAVIAFRLGDSTFGKALATIASHIPIVGSLAQGFVALTSAITGSGVAAERARRQTEDYVVAAVGLLRVQKMMRPFDPNATAEGTRAEEVEEIYQAEMDRLRTEAAAGKGSQYDRDTQEHILGKWRIKTLAKVQAEAIEEEVVARRKVANEIADFQITKAANLSRLRGEYEQREEAGLERRQILEKEINEAALRASGDVLRADLAREDEVWRKRLRTADSQDERDLVSARRQQSLDAIVATARQKHAEEWKTEHERMADEDLEAGLRRTARQPVTLGGVEITANYRGLAEGAEANETLRVLRDQKELQRVHNERLKEILVEFKRIASGEGFMLRV